MRFMHASISGITACFAASCVVAKAPARIQLSAVGVAAPAGAHVVVACGPILVAAAPNTTRIDEVPEGACVYFLDAGQTPFSGEIDDTEFGRTFPSQEALKAWLDAMNAGGWSFAHLAVVIMFFERPRPGTECSDVASLSMLPEGVVKSLVASNPPDERSGGNWRGFFVPADIGEACGDGRRVH